MGLGVQHADRTAIGLAPILLLALLLGSEVAVADSVFIHGLTEHYVDCSDPCNEVNWGLSYQKQLGDRFVHFGGLKNTENNFVGFASYGWSRQWRGFDLGLAAGLGVGYVDTDFSVTGAGLLPAMAVTVARGPVLMALIPGSVTFALRFDVPDKYELDSLAEAIRIGPADDTRPSALDESPRSGPVAGVDDPSTIGFPNRSATAALPARSSAAASR